MPVGGYVDVILTDGRIICDFNSPQGYLGFTIGDEHGYTTLAYPSGFPITGMAANAATADGTIVGGASGYVVTWSGPSFTPTVLGRIADQNTTAIAVSRDGKYLVGVSGTDDQAEAFVYSNGTFTAIDIPGYVYAQATGVNNDGTVVGFALGSAQGGRLAWMWKNGQLTVLPDAYGSDVASPTSINDNGLIVGTDGLHALLWDADGTAYSLDDLSNAAAMEDGVGYAYSINDSNQIIGAGGGNAYPGETVPFLLNPIAVPEPTSAAVLLAAFPLVAARRNYGRRK
jgi:probable HAF family extracellular repeat protein